jgi:GAF domain-containing protein
MPGPHTFGGLNLYSQKPDAFDHDDQQIAGAFAGQASAVVSNVVAYWAVLEQSQQLTAAMASRAVIEQAKGILMAAQHCTADEAFDLLRRASQRENRKLREIAIDMVARTSIVEEPE